MITAYIPIKKNSTRFPKKNFKKIENRFLFEHIIDTLLKTNLISEIIVDTDSFEIKDLISSLYSEVKIIERKKEILGEEFQGNDLIKANLIEFNNEHILQTHCTNPLITEKTLNIAIDLYLKKLNQFDSLFSVNTIKVRTYDFELKPINHNLKSLQKTQDLNVVYQENSNFFLFSKSSFITSNYSRIGLKPNVFEMSTIESIDIDYEEDFFLAEIIYKNRKKFPNLFGL